jgi:two-component system chemotaxis response regulator CheB
MTRIRVLTVDDAVVVRRLLFDALSGEPDIEVVGSAATGRIALQKIPQCNPDVVTLDVEMPDLDGIATVREIRRNWPKLPVIMFSTLTARGAAATLDALSAGASDYVTKPANVGGVTAGLARIREDLAPRIRSLAAAARGVTTAIAPAPVPRPPERPTPTAPALLAGKVEAVTIGTSTGGPNALATLLPGLPGDMGVPVFVVQHMPPLFTRLLADRLDQQCGLKVVEAVHGTVARPDHVYVAPGDFHMVVKRRGVDVVVELLQTPPENSCRPAVDVLFRSVADVYGRGVLGLVMTGMGQDGLVGARCIKDAGGTVVTQDEATSVVWGMPGFVTRAGLADAIRPLPSLADEIMLRIRAGRGRAVLEKGSVRS